MTINAERFLGIFGLKMQLIALTEHDLTILNFVNHDLFHDGGPYHVEINGLVFI